MPLRDNLRVATVNAHGPARKEIAFAMWLEEFTEAHSLDVVSLQELTRTYASEIRARLTDYRLWYTNHDAATGLLVRRDHHMADRQRVEHDYTWWGWKTSRVHPSRTDVALDIDGWLTMATVHAPPSVNVTARGLEGPRDRVKAYRNYYYNLKEFGQEHRREPDDLHLAFLGDFNEGRHSTGRYSPHWLAEKTGCEVHGRGIDLIVTDALTTQWARHEPGPGMDHTPRTCLLREVTA